MAKKDGTEVIGGEVTKYCTHEVTVPTEEFTTVAASRGAGLEDGSGTSRVDLTFVIALAVGVALAIAIAAGMFVYYLKSASPRSERDGSIEAREELL
ncbi:hypothetical protein DIPPA_22936 [Diplonema papillatum]|nr:hypothetical protein DIPPA_22936 [Diplonema papillatum]